jgi:TolB-like protein
LSLRYLFEDYALDTDRRELHRGPNVLSVAPQVFDLLEYLIRNRERVVSKDELVSAVWNGRIVSDAAITTRLNVVRAVVRDTGEEQRLIKTVPRKGFRFLGVVREAEMLQNPPADIRSAENGHGNAGPEPPPPLSIVVLPFTNIGVDPEQDYFADGVTESLTTDLSRISGSFVIACNTAFTFKGKPIDIKQVGRELNVRYVLEGSVQRVGNRLRLNVQLISSETCHCLWAERFDKPVADLFDMQDEVVSRLANTLKAQFIEAEARRAESSLHPNSMDFYFQGMAWLHKGQTPEQMAQAAGLFERAMTLDPKNIEALVSMATVNMTTATTFVTDDRAPRLAAAEMALIKALSLAPQHARARMILGDVKILTNRRAQGIAECQRALELDRNLAGAHASIGMAKLFMGRGAETEDHVRAAFRLSPRDTGSFRWKLLVGLAKLQLGADAEALVWLRQSVEANPNFPIVHFYLATALVLLGAVDEARAAAQAGLLLDPSFTIRRFRAGALSDDPIYLARRERTYQAMQMAGVPAG